jgi:nitroimidazol reductase NimA-like FMN-containing flavoprotein (pyridoxamine 5'-phosphate oxidase superfamily)
MRARTIYDEKEKNDIINKCDVCHVAMIDLQGAPYLVGMNFAFDGHYLYLHFGPEGKKMDVLKKNNSVCIAFSADYQMYFQNENVACSYSLKYRSVLWHGKAEEIDDFDEKIKVMNLFMQKYTGKTFSFNPPAIRHVAVFRITPKLIEGRAYGY